MGSSGAPSHLTRPPVGVVLVRICALAGAVLGLAAAALALAWRVGSRAALAVTAPGPATVEDVVVLLAAGGLAALVLRWLAGAGAAVAATGLAALHRPSAAVERASARLSPPVVRRLAAAALGIGVLGAVAAPASAGAPGRPPGVVSAATGTAPTTTPTATASTAPTTATGTGPATALPAVPSWPQEGTPWRASAPPVPPPVADLPAPLSAEGTRGGSPDERDVVVRRGDTLWSIAARSLPAGTGASEVAVEWPRWWAANRDVLGDDPDLLRPGQLLRAPRATR